MINLIRVTRVTPAAPHTNPDVHDTRMPRHALARHPPVNMVTRLITSSGSSMKPFVAGYKWQELTSQQTYVVHLTMARDKEPPHPAWNSASNARTCCGDALSSFPPSTQIQCNSRISHRFVSQDRDRGFEEDNRIEINQNIANVCGELIMPISIGFY